MGRKRLIFEPKHIYERKRRKERQKQIYAYLLNHPCVDCGETDPVVLEFDHVKGKKKWAITRALMAGYSWKTLLEEIAKCVVRCANCHRRRSAKQQGWTRSKLNEE